MRPLLRCSPFLLALALVGCGPDDGEDGATGPAGEPASAGVELEFLGRFQHRSAGGSAVYDEGGAEITAFDHLSERMVVVNALRGGVDVINASDPTALTLIQFVDVADLVETAQSLAPGSLAGVNSVSIYNGIAAVAVEANPKTDNGYIAFINCATLALVGSVQVGALPDMVTFSPDGTRVVVANEGEPSDGYAQNPAGTVSIISVAGGFAAPTVQTANFTDWDVGGARNGEVAGLVAKGLRFNTITGAVATFSEDMEPEYIAIGADGATAYVTLQENNAIAMINLATATVTTIHALGFKDFGLVGNEVDLGERDVDGSGGAGGLINLRTWGGVYGAYMPDAIAAYSVGSKTYLVTANEGDAREWPSATFADVDRLSTIFNGGNPLTGRLTGLEGNVNLGRLNILKDISTSSRVVTMGARSFSIWDAAAGTLVFDSGSEIEQKIAQRYPLYFNVSSTNNTLDNRSDDKGPEPEGVCIGTIGTTTYAFIGLERIGGIMIYDITNPQAAKFVSYRNDRDFTQDPDEGAGGPTDTNLGGDLAPEGLTFVPAERSPTQTALLIVGNEVSGTTVVYEIGDLLPPDANG